MSIGDGALSTNQRRHRYMEAHVTVGFFTDPTLCIGCKACEVACKEWNQVPADGFDWRGLSYDHTGELGHSTWRHVKFVEQDLRLGAQVAGPMVGPDGDGGEDPFRWIFLSDVCKHCEVAGCLEACPTGAIVRTDVGSVLVQDDVCNGCGYCVVGCPFGVVDRRPSGNGGNGANGGDACGGGAFKCTFCHDRQASGLVPACAKVCPTESIRFGPLEELRTLAAERVHALHASGVDDARIYDARDSSVGGLHAFFLIPGEPEAFGLPAHPIVPTVHLRPAWTSALVTSAAALAAVIAAFLVVP